MGNRAHVSSAQNLSALVETSVISKPYSALAPAPFVTVLTRPAASFAQLSACVFPLVPQAGPADLASAHTVENDPLA